MDQNDIDRRVFSTIRPYCVALSQLTLAPDGVFDPNSFKISRALKDLFASLEDCLDSDTQLSTNLADYIFVPVSNLLKQPKLGDLQTTLVLKILTVLIKHCWSQPSSIPYVLAKQLFPLITFLTGGSPNPKDLTELNLKSDELKEAGSKALKELFTSLSNQKSANIYDFFSNVENLPALGHVVTVLLEFAHNGKSISLQLAALDTLDSLYFELINDGEILSYILPGNVSTLTKIIAEVGDKAHYTVIVASLRNLTKLLALIYNDVDLGTDYKDVIDLENLNDGFEVSADFNNIVLRATDFKKVHRTKSWLHGTSSQVKIALTTIKKVRNHQRIEVKVETTNLAKSVLYDSLFSLKSSIPVVVEILAFLHRDKRLAINPQELFKSDNPKRQKILDQAISNDLDDYIESFPSIIQSPNEEKILSAVNAIGFTLTHSPSDYMVSKLVQSFVSEVAYLVNKSDSTKPKISQTDADIVDLIVISKTIGDVNRETVSLTVYDKLFSKEIQNEYSSLFQRLGETLDPTNLIEELISDDQKSFVEKAISLWVANSLTLGYLSRIKPQIVVNEFIKFEDDEVDPNYKPDFAYLLLDYSRNILIDIPQESKINSAELASSVSLDTIGIIADLLREDFRNELVDYLYPVIESLGSSSEIVRQHASNTAMIIANNLYSGSLHNLILENSDYLVDAISTRLSNGIITKTTAILAVCTKISGFKVIDNFKDVIEIMFSILDYYHGYTDICISFFVLFEIIADEVNKKYLSDYNQTKLEFHDSSSSYSPWGMTNVKQLINLLDKHNRDLDLNLSTGTESPSAEEEEVEAEINKDSDDEAEDEATTGNQDGKEEWTSPVPQETYKMLQQVVYYGERLLTHPSSKLHIQILKTLSKTLPIFATSAVHLNPIVASIWPILSHLVNSSDPKVVIPAAFAIKQVIEFAGSFVSNKFIDLWSNLKANQLLVSSSQTTLESKTLTLPGISKNCYESLIDMLVVGLNKLGRFVPDSISEEIIISCMGGVPDVERFQSHSDIYWVVKKNLYGTDYGLKIPKTLTVDGTEYEFTR